MFESHITVEMDREEFSNLCKKLHIKSVVIEQDSGSSLPQQMMTARFHPTKDYQQAYQAMMELSNHFPKVIRRKLEMISKKPVSCQYEEFHSKFKISYFRIPEFDHLVKSLGGHVSLNTMKNEDFRFMTCRDELTHKKILENLKIQFDYLGTIHEYVVYDDNPQIDSYWICGNCQLKPLGKIA